MDTPEIEHHEGTVHLTGEGNAPTVEQVDLKTFTPEFLDFMRKQAAEAMGVDPETLTLTGVTATTTAEQPDA